MSAVAELSPKVAEEFQTARLRVQGFPAALRLWDRHLSQEDHARLGDDFEAAFRGRGTAGMWRYLRGISNERAVIEIAQRLNFLTEADADWLLRELGEISDDADTCIQEAVASGGLVLVERPRGAYWECNLIEIAWDKQNAFWNLLITLAIHGKAGLPVDYTDFGEKNDQDYVSKLKSRLINRAKFPVSLSDRIVTAGRNTQRLDLAPQQIRIFEIVTTEPLRERTA
jgi:hypothetical protein